MNTFWLMSALMMTLALLFILPTLFSKRQQNMTGQAPTGVDVVKQQLQELAADLEAGKLDDDSYRAARTDLERELLAAEAGGAQPTRVRSGQWAALLLAVAVPAGALAIYNLLGNPALSTAAPAVAQAPAQQSAQQQQSHPIEEMVAKLAARLEQQPDDVEGWMMLGRSYQLLKRYDESVKAYAKAVELQPDNGGLLADYADVLVTANGGRFTDATGQLLQKALTLEPDNAKVLWLLGHYAFDRENYTEALDLWRKTAALIPAGGEDAQIINQQIRMAQEKLGIEPDATVTADASSQAAATGGAAIEVDVELAPDLQANVDAGDTLFIFARAQQGPRMPLAIVRKQAGDLPVSVTLDDSQAMSPAMKLSSFDEVVVGARISKTGQAMPASGDLQGLVEHVATQNGGKLKVVIDSTVP